MRRTCPARHGAARESRPVGGDGSAAGAGLITRRGHACCSAKLRHFWPDRRTVPGCGGCVPSSRELMTTAIAVVVSTVFAVTATAGCKVMAVPTEAPHDQHRKSGRHRCGGWWSSCRRGGQEGQALIGAVGGGPAGGDRQPYWTAVEAGSRRRTSSERDKAAPSRSRSFRAITEDHDDEPHSRLMSVPLRSSSASGRR